MVKNHFDQQASAALRQHARDPLYLNHDQLNLGLNGWQAGYKWTVETAVEPLVELALQMERTRTAQKEYYASAGSQRLLKEAKREEQRLDDMILALRDKGKLPERPRNQPTSQSGLF